MPHVNHADDARVFELIWDDEDVKAWVICWSEDQGTGFHDHDKSAAAIAVMSGEACEERLCIGSSAWSRTVVAGSGVDAPPSAVNRIRHSTARSGGGGPPTVVYCTISIRMIAPEENASCPFCAPGPQREVAARIKG
jgi:hypothetical protein